MSDQAATNRPSARPRRGRPQRSWAAEARNLAMAASTGAPVALQPDPGAALAALQVDAAQIGNDELECITACELASWLGVNRKTVYEYAARRVIPCRRIGRRLVFSRATLAAWLAK